MMKLRPYQEQAVMHALNMLTERGNSLIVAGTGAGKTIMMAAAIGKYCKGFKALHGKLPHVLVLVHRTEIHTQNHSKFSLVCPDIATSEITSVKKSLKGNVHFGMVQTVANLLPEFKQSGIYFDLIVIDEAHHAAASTYEEIIQYNDEGKPEAALLGVTATPNRGDELPLIHLWDNYYQITTRYLLDSHFLVRPTFLDLSPIFTTSVNDGKSEKGHLGKYVKNDPAGKEIIRKLCDDYLRNKQPGKTIIFAPTHEFCVMICDMLKEKGRKPAYLELGLDDTTRKEVVNSFENGDCDELINVDICTEGYDYPKLRNLVDFDTNGTHGQWVQKVGRVLRTCEGKTSCTVIDFGGNVDLYPEGVDADVNLEGAVKKEKGHRLTKDDFFKPERSKRETGNVVGQYESEYTPYHLPKGFETVNDAEYGIVIVACGAKNDCIVFKNQEEYCLFIGDKTVLKKVISGEFDKVMRNAVAVIGDVDYKEEPISRAQIKMLAPEYPTTALDRHGANCCICWKTWKETVKKLI